MFVLILIVGIASFSEKDTMVLANVPGFVEREQCEVAGKAAVAKFGTKTKPSMYVCLQHGRN